MIRNQQILIFIFVFFSLPKEHKFFINMQGSFLPIRFSQIFSLHCHAGFDKLLTYSHFWTTIVCVYIYLYAPSQVRNFYCFGRVNVFNKEKLLYKIIQLYKRCKSFSTFSICIQWLPFHILLQPLKKTNSY